jgi:hypothetical protein
MREVIVGIIMAWCGNIITYLSRMLLSNSVLRCCISANQAWLLVSSRSRESALISGHLVWSIKLTHLIADVRVSLVNWIVLAWSKL